MATGTDSWDGLAVPLYGNFTIKGRVGATDIMTFEGAGGVGDFIVCRNSAGTEQFVVEDDGSIATPTITCSLTVTKALTVAAGDVTVTAGDVVITKGQYLRFTSWPITPLLSGAANPYILGDVWLQKTSTYVQMAIAESASVVRYINTTSE